MFRTEIFRIFSRKTTLAAMIVTLLVVLYYNLGNSVWAEGVIDKGEIYHGEEAIARDKEIAAEFSGPLTEATVKAIWAKYGAPVNYTNRSTTLEAMTEAAAGGGNDNYCNRFVAEKFYEEVQGENGQITYVLREDLSGERYLQGNYTFAYAGNGGTGYWDSFLMAYVLTGIVIIISLCPMFSEDFAYRTADIILPSEKGRLVLWRVRMITGGCFATILYWLMCGIGFVQFLILYGSDTLKVSCKLVGMPMYIREGDMTLGKAILLLYLCGWFSILVLNVLVQTVSTRCGQSFSSLVRSLLLYMGPSALMRVILDMFPMGRINVFLHYICYSMPFSFPGTFLEAPLSSKIVMAGITAVVTLLGLGLGAVRYCRHQVKG